jgi:L-rhamnose mutarotase
MAAGRAQLRDANVTNYSIFIAEDILFAYYEYVGDDHAADIARIATDPATREWWLHTDPCQVRIVEERDRGRCSSPLRRSGTCHERRETIPARCRIPRYLCHFRGTPMSLRGIRGA